MPLTPNRRPVHALPFLVVTDLNMLRPPDDKVIPRPHSQEGEEDRHQHVDPQVTRYGCAAAAVAEPVEEGHGEYTLTNDDVLIRCYSHLLPCSEWGDGG